MTLTTEPQDGERIDVLQGTLDLLLLKMLEREPMHGYGLTLRLDETSGGTFQVNPGSLFPALHKLEEKGLIRAEWGTTENNRRAKFYTLTAAGRRRLAAEQRQWRKLTGAIDRVLEST